MGLKANTIAAGNPFTARGLGIGAYSRNMPGSITYAFAFGRGKSVPQGYNSEAALRMPVTSQGYISARVHADSTLAADLGAYGLMAASLDGEFDLIADANVLANGYATFAAEADMVAELGGVGNISANMDILARPSANDIAQEVWAFTNGTQTTGEQQAATLKAAKLAAALSA
jgi:hypothetical protein